MDSASGPAFAAAQPDPVARDARAAVGHLNADHADALLEIAQALGGYPDATAAVRGTYRYGIDLALDTPAGAQRPVSPSPLGSPNTANCARRASTSSSGQRRWQHEDAMTFLNQQDRINPKVAVSVVYVEAMFISIMDVSIVNVALPSIGRDFGVTPTAVVWISIAFLVSLAVSIPASGWLGDRFGGKPVLMTAIVLFTVASAMCGLATSVGELVLLGPAGGSGRDARAGRDAMLFRAFPPQERVRAASIIFLPTALAPALAPVIGGFLVTEASWRWVFDVNVPIGLAAFVFGVLFVKQHAESHPGAFDLPGFLLSGIGLALLMYGVSEGPNIGRGSTRFSSPSSPGSRS